MVEPTEQGPQSFRWGNIQNLGIEQIDHDIKNQVGTLVALNLVNDTKHKLIAVQEHTREQDLGVMFDPEAPAHKQLPILRDIAISEDADAYRAFGKAYLELDLKEKTGGDTGPKRRLPPKLQKNVKTKTRKQEVPMSIMNNVPTFVMEAQTLAKEFKAAMDFDNPAHDKLESTLDEHESGLYSPNSIKRIVDNLEEFNAEEYTDAEMELMAGVAFGYLVSYLADDDVRAELKRNGKTRNFFSDPDGSIEAMASEILVAFQDSRVEEVSSVATTMAAGMLRADVSKKASLFPTRKFRKEVAPERLALIQIIAVPSFLHAQQKMKKLYQDVAESHFQEGHDVNITGLTYGALTALDTIIDFVGEQVEKQPSEEAMLEALVIDDYKSYVIKGLRRLVAGQYVRNSRTNTRHQSNKKLLAKLSFSLGDDIEPKEEIQEQRSNPLIEEGLRLGGELADLQRPYSASSRELRAHDPGSKFFSLLRDGWTDPKTKEVLIEPNEDSKDVQSMVRFVISLGLQLQDETSKAVFGRLFSEINREAMLSEALGVNAYLTGKSYQGNTTLYDRTNWLNNHLSILKALDDHTTPVELREAVPQTIKATLEALDAYLDQAALDEQASA